MSTRDELTKEMKDDIEEIGDRYFDDELNKEEAVEELRELKKQGKESFFHAFQVADRTNELAKELKEVVYDE